jgi:hypothetical protein
MGMALRVRWASGWWSFVCEFCWKLEGVYGLGAVDRTKEGVGCSWCCSGDCSGEPLESEERSEPEEWMDCSCIVSVPRYDRTGWQILAGRATYIILSEQVERAEHLVVLNVERAGGLEVALEGNGRGGFHVELLGGADLAELLLLMLGRDPWRAPRSAAVVVVVVVLVGGEVLGVVLCTVVEELRHGGIVLMADGMESVRGCAKGR